MSKCSNVRSSTQTGEDVPLKKVVVAMRGVLIKRYPKTVKVFAFPMPERECEYYDTDYGIGNPEYRNADNKGRLQLLLKLKRQLVEQHRFSEKLVHDALRVIPAYRRAMRRATRS